MAWSELVNRRTQNGKLFQDSLDGKHFAFDGIGATLHYESAIDSGVFDTPINATPVQVNNAQLNGWTITANGWHYALGRPKSGAFNNLDGTVGFGGRKGQNWLRFRLTRAGYLKWSTREWGDISGAPTYTRTNLTRTTRTTTIDTSGEALPIESVATWNNIWTTPNGGALNIGWRMNGDQLKEEITVTQLARDWIVANRPPGFFFPGVVLNDVYFGFVIRLDWSDVPKIMRAGIQQSIENDFADDGEALELRDASSRLLAFLPLDEVFVTNGTGLVVARQSLRKRFYKDSDNNYYLLIGVRCDLLNGMPSGDLRFDPTVDVTINASALDAGQENVGTGVILNDVNCSLSQTGGGGLYAYHGARYQITGPASGNTVNSNTYVQFYCEQDLAMDATMDFNNVDTAAAFTTATNNLSGRTLTGSPITWTGTMSNFAYNSSPSLATPLQVVFNRAGWASGNYVAIISHGRSASEVRIRTYDNSASTAPKIHIDYTAGAAAASLAAKRRLNTLIRM